MAYSHVHHKNHAKKWRVSHDLGLMTPPVIRENKYGKKRYLDSSTRPQEIATASKVTNNVGKFEVG